MVKWVRQQRSQPIRPVDFYLADPSGSPDSVAFVRFELSNCGFNVPALYPRSPCLLRPALSRFWCMPVGHRVSVLYR